MQLDSMNDQKKIRVLVVHSQLQQHGSERLMYEVCEALDKSRFEVSILVRPFFIRNQFYFAKFTKLAIPIHCRLVTKRHARFPIKWLYDRSGTLRKLLAWFQQFLVRGLCRPLVEWADIIAVIGIETYCDAFAPWLDASGKVVIHHVTHRFQFERDYFAECHQRRIVVGDEQQRLEVMASPLHGCEIFYFPLSMSLGKLPRLAVNAPSSGRPVRVAVVSRLYRDRPNEQLFRCFAALCRVVDSELFFYGGGDPALYSALLAQLGIVDKVIFKGHQSNLEESLRRDRPTVSWLVAAGPSISYGSVEMSSLGIPMVFWNLSSLSYEEILAKTDGALHAFADESAFTYFNLGLFRDSANLQEHADRLCDHVRNRFEIGRYISSLEEYYCLVAARRSGLFL